MNQDDEKKVKMDVRKIIEAMILRVFNGSLPETTMAPMIDKVHETYMKSIKECCCDDED